MARRPDKKLNIQRPISFWNAFGSEAEPGWKLTKVKSSKHVNSLKLLEGLGAVDCEWGEDDTTTSRPNAPSTVELTTCEKLQVGSNLTALGFHLATLPVDPRVGKMMIYGKSFLHLILLCGNDVQAHICTSHL